MNTDFLLTSEHSICAKEVQKAAVLLSVLLGHVPLPTAVSALTLERINRVLIRLEANQVISEQLIGELHDLAHSIHLDLERHTRTFFVADECHIDGGVVMSEVLGAGLPLLDILTHVEDLMEAAVEAVAWQRAQA